MNTFEKKIYNASSISRKHETSNEYYANNKKMTSWNVSWNTTRTIRSTP